MLDIWMGFQYDNRPTVLITWRISRLQADSNMKVFIYLTQRT